MSDSFMKAPCQHCPFKISVKPFLHPERAAEIAYAAQNPFSSFPCHKTTESADDDSGEMIETAASKQCAGFLTLRAQELGVEECPEGFEPAWTDVYTDTHEMIDAYEQEWDSRGHSNA